MPKIGFSNPYIAEYVDSGMGHVGYRNGMRAGRGVSRTLTPNDSSSNDFFADNKRAESEDGIFTGADFALEVAELTQEASQKFLGLETKKFTVNGEEVTALVHNDNSKPPYLGYGDIEKTMVNGVTGWRAAVLCKIKFRVPEDAATTQGETIDWQTETINGKVERSDMPDGDWCYTAVFDSESKADAFIRHVLNIDDAKIEALQVVSTQGTAAGTTAIAVEQEPIEGRSYRYLLGSGLALPTLYQDLSSWNTWNGVSNIEAAAGQEIIIAEVDTLGLAMAAGKATVTVKEE